MTRPAPTAGTVLAYAVLDATRPLPLAVIPDLPDANLETREVAGLLVIHSRLAPQPAAPDLEHLQTFYKVIERLHAHHDILPLRWGQHFPHPQALARAITADADGYKRQLARLAGATEMGIRLLAADTQSTPERVPRHPPAPPGRAFLEQRRARYGMDATVQEQQQRIEETCRESFTGLFHEIKSETAQDTDSRVIIRVHFLILRALVARFRRTYADLRPVEGMPMRLTGPWPPFNFTA